MQKITELIIIHGNGWLMGLSALVLAVLQWKKAKSRDQSAPTTSPPSESREPVLDAAPAANLDNAWRKASWVAMRLAVLQFFLGALGSALSAVNASAVTPLFVATQLMMFFIMLTGWLSMHFSVDSLRRRWALGLRE